ncbi:MAG TPA: VOC family protein [Terriglobales bacterium]|jgi:uncharacterized glyoxalase superfamily protein PhnB|nr:VOC family protein [Terriglobales bacterium]
MPNAADSSTIKIGGTAPVLLAKDVAHTVAYYCVVLGFKVEFTQNEKYIGVVRGGVHVHIADANGIEPRSNRSAWSDTLEPADVNFFVDDVDALYKELIKSGAKIDREPQDRNYGVRDFELNDCNGYLLRFNQIL